MVGIYLGSIRKTNTHFLCIIKICLTLSSENARIVQNNNNNDDDDGGDDDDRNIIAQIVN